jgi:glucokinase
MNLVAAQQVVRHAIAIDIGGTKIAAAVVRSDGKLFGRNSMAVRPTHDPEVMLKQVLDCATLAVEMSSVTASGIIGVGCGCGGPMKWPEGIVSTINIPAWRDFPLRQRLTDAFPGLPVFIHNDAIALAVGEHWQGHAAGARNMLAMTVSTGIGGGLILDGELFHGKSGNAGHVGHIIIEPCGPICGCGARGCLEAVASGPSTVSWALAQGWQPTSSESADGFGLAQAAEAGDDIARRALIRAGAAVGTGTASLANVLDLNVVVIAGGFSNSGQYFWEALHRAFGSYTMMSFAQRTRVELGGSRGETGLLGAGGFVLFPDKYGWPL